MGADLGGQQAASRLITVAATVEGRGMARRPSAARQGESRLA